MKRRFCTEPVLPFWTFQCGVGNSIAEHQMASHGVCGASCFSAGCNSIRTARLRKWCIMQGSLGPRGKEGTGYCTGYECHIVLIHPLKTNF